MPKNSNPHKVETIVVEDSPMEVFVFEPAESGRHPAIMLAQHIPVGHTGIENDVFTLRTAQRLSDNGYVVAVPFIFHWWPKDAAMQLKRDESRDKFMVSDMQAAYELLVRRQNVDPQNIAVVGHCWGGRVAWLAACHIPQLAGCAVFYGGRIKIAMDDDASNPAPLELARNIRCPVIGFFGNDDANPSPADVDDYARALTQAQIEHQFHRYDDAGHAFQNFPTPDRYKEQQSEDAWEKLLEFLSQRLSSSDHTT